MPCKDCNCKCIKDDKKRLKLEGKKKCLKCGEIKKMGAFDKSRAKCKECRKQRNENYYKDKTKPKNTVKQKIKTIKTFLLDEEDDDIKELLTVKMHNLKKQLTS